MRHQLNIGWGKPCALCLAPLFHHTAMDRDGDDSVLKKEPRTGTTVGCGIELESDPNYPAIRHQLPMCAQPRSSGASTGSGAAEVDTHHGKRL